MVDYICELTTSLYRVGSSEPLATVVTTVPVPPGKRVSSFKDNVYSLVPFSEGIGLRVESLLSSWIPVAGYKLVCEVSRHIPWPCPSSASCSDRSIVHDIVAQILGIVLSKIS